MTEPQSFLGDRIHLYGGDSREVLKQFPDNHFDSIVTDPPYALVSIVKRFGGPNAAPAKGNDAYMRASAGFMNRTWDTGETAFAAEFWAECLRVLKPGGHVAAFSGTRTYHRMAVAIEDAGFEIRDQLAWVYGQGFPKSHDVSKAIDKLDVVGPRRARALLFTEWMRTTGLTARRINEITNSSMASHYLTSGEQPEVATRSMFELLRPHIPIEVPSFVEGLIDSREVESENLKRRPVVGQHAQEAQAAKWRAAYQGGTVAEAGAITEAFTPEAQKWRGWGTALKPAWEPICLGRKPLVGTVAENVLEHGTGALNIDGCRVGTEGGTAKGRSADKSQTSSVGGYLNAKAGTPIDAGRWPANIVHDGSDEVLAAFPETGPAKPGVRDPNGTMGYHGGASGLPGVVSGHEDNGGSAARFFYTAKADKLDRIGSKHPTVKPVDLMAWLIRLVTPKGGLVLDPFAGYGSTGEAAWREGMRCVLVEREAEYQADIAERLRLADAGPATRKARAVKQAANDNLPLFARAV